MRLEARITRETPVGRASQLILHSLVSLEDGKGTSEMIEIPFNPFVFDEETRNIDSVPKRCPRTNESYVCSFRELFVQ